MALLGNTLASVPAQLGIYASRGQQAVGIQKSKFADMKNASRNKAQIRPERPQNRFQEAKKDSRARGFATPKQSSARQTAWQGGPSRASPPHEPANCKAESRRFFKQKRLQQNASRGYLTCPRAAPGSSKVFTPRHTDFEPKSSKTPRIACRKRRARPGNDVSNRAGFPQALGNPRGREELTGSRPAWSASHGSATGQICWGGAGDLTPNPPESGTRASFPHTRGKGFRR